jgi:hypothetical protein
MVWPSDAAKAPDRIGVDGSRPTKDHLAPSISLRSAGSDGASPIRYAALMAA